MPIEETWKYKDTSVDYCADCFGSFGVFLTTHQFIFPIDKRWLETACKLTELELFSVDFLLYVALTFLRKRCPETFSLFLEVRLG